MAVTKNGRYPYPEQSWSEARMRKVGEAEAEAKGEQYAMLWRRKGQPEFAGGVEAEKFAGAAARGRGGPSVSGPSARSEVTKGPGGLSPDTIAQQKSHIEAMGNQWNSGLVDWQKYHREVKYKGWEVLWAPLDMMPTGGPVMTGRDLQTQLLRSAKEDFEYYRSGGQEKGEPPPNTIGRTILDVLRSGKSVGEAASAAQKHIEGSRSIVLKDPNNKIHEIPLENMEE